MTCKYAWQDSNLRHKWVGSLKVVWMAPPTVISAADREHAAWTASPTAWLFALATTPRRTEPHARPTVVATPTRPRSAPIGRAAANLAAGAPALRPESPLRRHACDARDSTIATPRPAPPDSREAGSAPHNAAPSINDRPLGSGTTCHAPHHMNNKKGRVLRFTAADLLPSDTRRINAPRCQRRHLMSG